MLALRADCNPAANRRIEILAHRRSIQRREIHANPFGLGILFVERLQVVRDPVARIEHAALPIEHIGQRIVVVMCDKLGIDVAALIEAAQIRQRILDAVLRAAPHQLAVVFDPEFRIGAKARKQSARRIVQGRIQQHSVGVVDPVSIEVSRHEGVHQRRQLVNRFRCLESQRVHPVLAQPDVGEGVRIRDAARNSVGVPVIGGHFHHHSAVGVDDIAVDGGEIGVDQFFHRDDQFCFCKLQQVGLGGHQKHVRNIACGDFQAQLRDIAFVGAVDQPVVVEIDVQPAGNRIDVAVFLQRLAPPLVPGRHVGFKVGVVVIDDGQFDGLLIGRNLVAFAVVFLPPFLQVVRGELHLFLVEARFMLVDGECRSAQEHARGEQHSNEPFQRSSSFTVISVNGHSPLHFYYNFYSVQSQFCIFYI